MPIRSPSSLIRAKIWALLLVATAFLAASALGSQSHWVDTYVNPMDVSLADPAILKDSDGKYYAYGTGMQCWFSTNLIDWREANIFGIYTAPAGDTRTNFWAPEVIKRPSDGKYLMFYTAQPQGGRLSIYLAQSNSPTSGFADVYKDAGGAAVPLFFTDAGDAWIDAHPFLDTDGKAYLYVTKDIASASSRPNRGAIFVLPLDLTNLTVGAPVKVLSPNASGWEVRPGGGTDIEGAYVVKHKGQYFLFYSGNGYWADTYAIGYAVATSPEGPFAKDEARNPILRSGGGLFGPGHCSAALSPDGKEYFMFYHSKIKSSSGGERQLCMDRINFLGAPGQQFIQMNAVKTTTATAASWVGQMLPSGVSTQPFCPAVEPFNALDLNIWHFMDENVWNRSVSGGFLHIKASSGDVLGAGTWISNLALAYVAQDAEWQVTTKIADWAPTADDQRIFVTIWKDQQNFVRLNDLYSSGRKLRVLKEENGAATFYDVANTLADSAKWLRVRKNGRHFSFWVSADGSTFSELASGDLTGYSADWALDRQLQVGLGAVCPSGQSLTAKFDEVRYERLSPYAAGWSDEFNGSKIERAAWIIYNEDQTHYGLPSSGTLRIRMQDGDWAHARRDMRNVFLQSARPGEWSISTRIATPALDGNYDQAFLIVAKDPDNFIKFGRAYIDGVKLEAGIETAGAWQPTTIDDPWSLAEAVEFRITKIGTTYYCEASTDGAHWVQVAKTTAVWTPLFFGVGASSPGSGHQYDCTFDWFRVDNPARPTGAGDWVIWR